MAATLVALAVTCGTIGVISARNANMNKNLLTGIGFNELNNIETRLDLAQLLY